MLTKFISRFGRMVSLLVVIAMFLAACQPSAAPTVAPTTEASPVPAEETQPAAPGEKVKITFWSHDFPPREKLDRKYMDKFKADHPNIDIEYVLGPGDDTQYITKLMTAMAGGEGPDCYNLITLGAGPILAQGMATPVDLSLYGYKDLADFENNYVKGTLEGFVYDGKLYAIPSEVSIYDMFVNKQMLADAGLDADKDYPKTWDDLLPLAQKMNKEESGQLVQRAFDFTYGMPDDATSPVLTLAGMAYQLGGQLLNEDGTEALVNTEPWIRTYQFVQDWVYKEKYGSPALTVAFIGFYEGSVAMTVSGSWYSSYVQEQNPAIYDAHTVKPLPRWKDAINDTGAFMYAYGLFTNSASGPEKQKVCQELIKELSSYPENYLKDAGLLQPTIALSQSETFKSIPNLDVFLKDMEGTPYWPAHPKSFEMADVLTRALQRVVSEQQPVKESLDTAKTEIDALLTSQ